MPQDPDLYGKRTAKRKKTELGLSNTLDFTAHMQSLIEAKPNDSLSKSGAKKSSAAHQSSPLPSRKKSKTVEDANEKNGRTANKSKSPWAKRPVQGSAAELSAHEREQIRRNMAIKARRYAQMQRGDYIPREGELPSLVDFDRKWAEKRRDGEASESERTSSSEEDSDSDSDSGNKDEEENDASAAKEMVEYVDEFGRTRTVSKARRERDLRREERAARTAQDLDDMRARPAPPTDASRLLYGDVIQTEAIEAAVDRSAEWSKRGEDGGDFAPTHYRATDDVRTRGAAFYAFATDDEKAREAQMQALADERTKTETARAARSAQLDARKQEMAARRAALAERKAKKQADSFLDGLGKNLYTGSDDGE
ncbi:hypothetical protein SEPCBS57363_001770 [Sporothrix epigloea]|uniref:Uncharacterized protein n=1 Tax=Sporothrix epigloea TaxID=1892477 RepID=A0ABP0DDE2_9PEZI